jgi:hypothetical protein
VRLLARTVLAASLAAAPALAVPYGVRYSPPSLPIVPPDSTGLVDVTLANIGDLPWRRGDDYRLGWRWVPHPGTPVLALPVEDRPILRGDVPPGTSIRVPTPIRTPSSTGLWQLVWDLYKGGRPLSESGARPLDQFVEVRASAVTDLCTALECDRVPPFPLENLNLSGVLGVVRPGATVLLMGEQFGSSPGRAELRLGTTNRALLDVEFLAGGRGVTGRVPPDISGVADGPGWMRVVTSRGQASNWQEVSFRADREVLPLSWFDVTVTCSSEAETNDCRRIRAGFLGGYHSNFFQGDSGVDRFHATLTNGWTFYNRSRLNVLSGSGDSSRSRRFSPTTPSFDVSWSFGPFGSAGYTFEVFIVGPRGVPYR